MQAWVAVKRVVDYRVKVRVNRDQTAVETQSVKKAMNPFDEIAVEEALRWREAGNIDEVVAVSVGPLACKETLLSALAMGADRAILIEAPESLEPLLVAQLLKTLALADAPDVIVTGKQAIDDDCNQTGQMLAALLDWPQATFASEVVWQEGALRVRREVDGGMITLQVQLPAVITTDLRLNTPRYTALPNIMKAKSKSLSVMPASELGVDLTPRLEILSVAPPEKRPPGVKVASLEELMDKLKNILGAVRCAR